MPGDVEGGKQLEEVEGVSELPAWRTQNIHGLCHSLIIDVKGIHFQFLALFSLSHITATHLDNRCVKSKRLGY